ncbi:hypothetical protein L195_g052479, partial [Trifolium pratense]
GDNCREDIAVDVVNSDDFLYPNQSGEGVIENGSLDGSANSTNIHHSVKGGVNRRRSKSEELGRVNKSNNLYEEVSGGKGEGKGGVYSDGPRAVYNKLNSGPTFNQVSRLTEGERSRKKNTSEHSKILFLPSRSLRNQNQLVLSLRNRKQQSNVAKSQSISISARKEDVPKSISLEER